MEPRANPEEIRKRIAEYSRMMPGNFDPGLFGACLGILDKLTQNRRYSLIEWLFPDVEWKGRVSTKRMSAAEKIGLMKWVGPTKATDTSPWTGAPPLRAEIDAIFVKMGELVQAELPKPGQAHLSREASKSRMRKYFLDTFEGIPLMVCGCEASGKTIEGNPFCIEHCTRDGEMNSDAYIVREIISQEDKILEELGYAVT